MEEKNAIVVFHDKKIRRIWHKNKWFFSVVDIIQALTDSSNARRYWSDLKIRLADEGFELYDIIVQLKLESSDGKKYSTDCSDTKGMFRIIQSIPSMKAEPFKQWLAQVGYERIEEIQDPEIGHNRLREYYELKGYPKDWIDKRLRGVVIRQDLTGEWKNRGVKEKPEFAILTNEISKATFGKTVGEYKKYKGLIKQNLRDHMSDWELILTMVGEKAKTDITRKEDSQGFEECKGPAKKGGRIAGRTRKDIEDSIGESIITEDNFLHKDKKKKLK